MKKIIFKKPINGQSLLEVLAIVSAISLAILGLVRGLTISLKNTQVVGEKRKAEVYGREAQEWLVSERDNSWQNLSTNLGTYCLHELTWDLLGDCEADQAVDADGLFFRKVFLEAITGEKIDGLITVSWQTSSGMDSFEIPVTLTKWK
ncbi:hypothetical protein ACFLZP_03615 [Patescibacteria group bacterium]